MAQKSTPEGRWRRRGRQELLDQTKKIADPCWSRSSYERQAKTESPCLDTLVIEWELETIS